MKVLPRLNLPALAAGVAVLFAVWVVGSTLWWIAHSYVALPFWDQWETVKDYGRLRDGAYGLGDLFSQQNEHRIAFPRLVFFADDLFFRGRDILNLSVITGFQLLHATLLTRLVGRLERPLAMATAALVFALLLSLGQWENLTWGFQVQFVDVFAVATASFLLLASAVAARGRWGQIGLFCASGACLTVAVFSMANGLAAVVLAVGLALALRAPRWMTAGFAALLVVLALIYFHGYRPVTQHSTVAYALAHPGDYVVYLLSYLGNPAGLLLHRPPTALLAGVTRHGPLVLGGLAGVLTIVMLARIVLSGGKDRTELVLAAVVAFIGLTAAMTAVGRLSFGVEQAYSERYVHTVGDLLGCAGGFLGARRPGGATLEPRRRRGRLRGARDCCCFGCNCMRRHS